ncbi:MAG: serine kinase [Bacteroidetes bacterium]|nr:serine kinase [Bacteroidota bacterium]
MYKYWGFGLHIASEIEFPELLPMEFDLPDVEFVLGKMPEIKEDISVSTKNFSYYITDNELLFKVYDIAGYYAANGNKIIIEPFTNVQDMRSIRLYVLATAIAAILLQRGLLPLHASAIIKNDELVFITGDSQAGKSTTLAGLLKNGNTVFSDDVVVIKKNENSKITVSASYPMMKLWDDTLDKLNDALFRDRSFRVKHDIDKYGIFFHDNFNTNSYSVSKVFILRKQEIPQIVSRKLKGTEAFDALTKQVYRPMLIHNNSLRALCFTLLTDIVQNSSIYEVCRPLECNPDELLKYVETFL